ncbi:Dynein light chain type 1 family protein [Trifolium repens]|nr:Dynein light chain type 1 family protein [Trifolium repens]
MANKKNKRRNKNKNNVTGGAPPAANPISNSPPPPVPTEEPIIPNIAEIEKLAIDLATAAFEKHRFDIDVAKEMKNEFDNRYGPSWHCIIGRDFGFFISCERNCYFRFQLNLKNVLLFKCG